MFTNIRINSDGTFSGDCDGLSFSAQFPLFLIRRAWENGCNFEDLADGFGEGRGTMGDWSAIRDSSHEAVERMFERSLNFFEGPLNFFSAEVEKRIAALENDAYNRGYEDGHNDGYEDMTMDTQEREDGWSGSLISEPL